MLDFLRRDGDTSNTVIGIILLILLLVFIGPDVLAQLLSRSLPFIDEGVPCRVLQSASDRSQHQSLIGRSTTNPLVLRTIADPIPAVDSGQTWVVRIVIENDTIGTVPFVFDPEQVIVGDQQGSSGVGLIFSPPVNLATGFLRTNQGANTIPNDNIKILGPGQQCVHRVEFPANQLAPLLQQQVSVRSYYRITTAGQVFQTNAVATPIFNDQGLNRIAGGYV